MIYCVKCGGWFPSSLTGPAYNGLVGNCLLHDSPRERTKPEPATSGENISDPTWFDAGWNPLKNQ
jgi:hypothetical protein